MYFCVGATSLSVRWVYHFDWKPVGARFGQHLTQLQGCKAWMVSLGPAGQVLCAKAVTRLAPDSIHSCESWGNCHFLINANVLWSPVIPRSICTLWHRSLYAINRMLALGFVHVIYVDCILCVYLHTSHHVLARVRDSRVSVGMAQYLTAIS